MALVQAYARMMPRIEADERLKAVANGALGAGNIERFEARRAIRRLEETARGERRRAAKATPAALKAMGIGVASAPSKAPEKAQSDV